MNEPLAAEAHELRASKGPAPSAAGSAGFGGAEGDPFADPRFDAEDGSVPPIGDLDTDFFTRGSGPWWPTEELEIEPAPPSARLIALKSVAVRRRRAQFTKYVTAAVGVCGIVCLTALVKVVVSRAAGTDDVDMASSHAASVGEGATISAAPSASAAAPSVSAVPVASAASATSAASVEQAAVEAPTTASAAAADPAPSGTTAAGTTASGAPADSALNAAATTAASAPSISPSAVAPADSTQAPAAPVAAVAPAMPAMPAGEAQAASSSASVASAPPAPDNASPEQSAAEAAAAREVARTELSRGHARQSIEAGERSVALDPTDGEAWLVLGAAYQSKGAIADARRCFKACVSQAKRGPRGECSAMLR